MAQIQVTKEDPKFQPVTLTLTFKTEEELDAFRVMCGQNITVSEAVNLTFSEKRALGHLLCAIYHKL